MQFPSFSLCSHLYPQVAYILSDLTFDLSAVFLREKTDMWIDCFNNSGIIPYLPHLHLLTLSSAMSESLRGGTPHPRSRLMITDIRSHN